jgi:hypothetical protein
MSLNNCVLNFYVPHHHTSKQLNYSIKLLRTEDMEPAATIELDTKPIISDFIFQNVTRFVKELAFGLGYSMIFINKTRMLLLKTVKRYEGMRENEKDENA